MELVEALEATVKGQPVRSRTDFAMFCCWSSLMFIYQLTTEHLQGLVGRIFGSDVQQSVDVGRPGTVRIAHMAVWNSIILI